MFFGSYVVILVHFSSKTKKFFIFSPLFAPLSKRFFTPRGGGVEGGRAIRAEGGGEHSHGGEGGVRRRGRRGAASIRAEGGQAFSLLHFLRGVL